MKASDAGQSPINRYRCYRYLLHPTFRQRAALELLLRNQCELYNAALEERIGAWKWERRSVSYFDQSRTLTQLRDIRPEILDSGVTVCRGTLKCLDRTFGDFYRRCQKGEPPGFPRFKSVHRWSSVQWDDRIAGWKLTTELNRLYLKGIGDVKIGLHRSLRGSPMTITVAREGRRWWVTVGCASVPATPLVPTSEEVGIDLGVIAVVATSDGEVVTKGRYGEHAAAQLADAQRSLATKTRGSGRRRKAVERVARHHRKVRNQRKDLAHKLSRRLVDEYDLICHEDLKIRNMTRRPKPRPNKDGGFDPNRAVAKSRLNRSVRDAGWGQLLQMIAYKAEEAGREVIAVDPRHTSQRCSSCGHTEAANRVTQAKFRCRACGFTEHADVNAAKNILEAGRALRAKACGGDEQPRYPEDMARDRAGTTEP